MSADGRPLDPAATLPPAAGDLTLPPAGDGLSAVPEHVAVPGYQIVGELGRGGMGVVYQARQAGLNRDVALKMILAGGHASATDLARFRAEAEAVARLQHPNVVQVYEVGEAAGVPYFSLEFCAGGSLEKRLNGVPQPPKQAAELIETLARAVDAAHQAGIVHRDLKPGNVLLTAGGTPKVTDFGLAKQLDSGSGRTASGAILGTPSYMAPEQADGSKQIGPAADTYALGAILYELLTGRPPFRAATPLDTILQVVHAEPVPPTRLNGQVPRDLETITLKCLHKDPAKRYTSAAALADELHRWQAGEPITARPAGMAEKAAKWAKRRPAVVGLAATVVLAVVAGFVGVLYELRIATEARTRAETQEGLATQRAGELATEREQVRRELHQSDLLRTDLQVGGKQFAEAEQLLWQAHLTRPDDDDGRAYWRLWDLYRRYPRRFGCWLGSHDRCCTSPDGRRVVSVKRSDVRILDAESGAIGVEFRIPQSEICAAAFNHDGSMLGLASANDGTVTIWDCSAKPTLRATLSPPALPRPALTLSLGGMMAGLAPEELADMQRKLFYARTQLCFLDGERVLVANPDAAAVWTLDGPAVLASTRLEAPSGLISLNGGGAILSPASAGDTIAVVLDATFEAGDVQLWKLPASTGGTITRTQLDFDDSTGFRRGPPRTRKSGLTNPGGVAPNELLIHAVALSPDGKWLVTQDNKHMRCWDVATGARRGEAPAIPQFGRGFLQVTPDNAAVLGVDREAIHLWRLPGLESFRTIPKMEEGGYQRSVVMSADGRRTFVEGGLVVGGYDRQPVDATRVLVPPEARGGRSPTPRGIAATGPVVGHNYDGVSVFRDGRWERLAAGGRFSAGSGSILTPDGSTVVEVESGIFSSAVNVLDVATRRKRSFPFRDQAGGNVRLLQNVAVSRDNHLLVAGTLNGLLILDLTAGKTVRGIEGRAFMNAMFTPDGRAVLCMNRQKDELILLDVADGKVTVHAPVSASETNLAVSPDGAIVVTAAERKLIWRDAATLTVTRETPSVEHLAVTAFSPDGRLLAAGGQEGKLRLWDVHRREELAAIDLAAGSIDKLVFTPDSRKIRFIAEKQVGELDLHACDPYVEGNLTWNLLRLLPELAPAEAERVLGRLRDKHPNAYRAGLTALQRN